MPRQARLDAPGILHHIIIRGIERRKIFLNNTDYEDFLDRLAKLLPETQTACYAWALMPNHGHFLFCTGKQPIATLMRRLLTGYAVSFNRRHKRDGRLFQNRYKSIICQEDAYLMELVRYIHLNPLRARIVLSFDELNAYPYCGHSALMGKQKKSWQNVDYILKHFGRTVQKTRKDYLIFLEQGITQGRREDLTGGGLIRSLGGWTEIKKNRGKTGDHCMSDERILGNGSFVDTIISQSAEAFDRRYELKRRGYDLNGIARRVADVLRIKEEDVFAKGSQKMKVKARSILCYWAVREVGLSIRALAKRLDMSAPGVGYAVERGAAIVLENKYNLIPE